MIIFCSSDRPGLLRRWGVQQERPRLEEENDGRQTIYIHQEFDFCVQMYELLCQRLDCDPKVLFTSRRWFLKDKQNCEHGLMRCLCLECVSTHNPDSAFAETGCTTVSRSSLAPTTLACHSH
jgi:hypothetical protein